MALSNPETLSLECSELPDQVLFVGEVTLGEKARKFRRQDTKRHEQKQRILMAVVALLNSGGGIVRAEITNENYSYCRDGIGLDLEEALKQLVNPSTLEDYFGFSQIGMTFLIFVKTWSSFGGRVRLCSIDTGLRIRSGTSALNVENNAVTEFLMKQKMKRNLAKGQGDEPVAKRRRFLSGDRPNGQQLFERQEVQLEEELPFGESVNVELKSFTTEKQLFKRLKEIIPKYISAFANTDGGYLFIGVDDKTKKVVGCGRGLDKNSIKTQVENMCLRVISVHSSGCTQENDCSVEVRILDVLGGHASDSRYVVAIHIPKFCCTVFEKHPDSWHFEGTEVCQIQAEVWLEKMQVTDPDEFCAQFEKVLSQNAAPPKCKPVYGIKDDHLSTLQQKLFPVYEGKVTITPDDLKKHQWEKYPNLQNLMPEDSRGVLILSNSWAVDIDRPKNEEVICEALLICEQDYPKLFIMVENGSSDLWEYAKDTASHLKQKLVNLGGYSEWVCVIPQLVNCETGQLIPRDQGSPDTVTGHQYPECYKPENIEVVRALLQALVIVVMSFTSALSNQLGQEFLNLLTVEQFEILHSKYDVEDMRELFVHGYPGTGKTVLATQAIRRIKNTFGCETSNILYICENAPLKEFIRRENICRSVTQSYFMKEEFPDIKHIIVDEAQNFQLEDGDWYKKAKQIVEPDNGVFWVFLDYFQLSHTEPNGLPLPSRQTNKIILDKSLRNSVAVHDEVCKILDRIRENTSEVQKDLEGHMEKMITRKTCLHSFQGCYKNIIATENSILSSLTSLVKDLQKRGNSPKDIAILVSTWDDVSPYQSHLNQTTGLPMGSAEEIDENVVVVDSVRRFSGLERNIVILINPVVHLFQRKIKEQFLVSGISRARIRLYVISVKRKSKNGIKSVKGTTG